MNNNPQPTNVIQIPLKKSGLFLMLGVVALLLVVVCLPIIIAFVNHSLSDAEQILLLPMVLILILIAITYGIYYIVRMFDKNPAIIISDEGIIDNTNAASFGFVPWSEVIGMKPAMPGYFKLIIKNPQYYKNRERRFMKRLLLKTNWMARDGIAIAVDFADISFVDLNQLIEERHARAVWQYQQQPQPPIAPQQ